MNNLGGEFETRLQRLGFLNLVKINNFPDLAPFLPLASLVKSSDDVDYCPSKESSGPTSLLILQHHSRSGLSSPNQAILISFSLAWALGLQN
jgi:hypothetical protein